MSIAMQTGTATEISLGVGVFHYTSPQYGSYPVVGHVVRRH